MNVGYVRVSTIEQNPARQEVLMEQLGVEKVFCDRVSGKDKERPELKKMMSFVREGDTVIVESMSRFARNTKDLLELVQELTDKGVEFVSQKENIDTTTPQGRFMLTVFAAIAELEREQIHQRMLEGVAIAKAEHRFRGGQPKKYDKEKFVQLYGQVQRGEILRQYAAKQLGLSSTTFWRRCVEYEKELGIRK